MLFKNKKILVLLFIFFLSKMFQIFPNKSFKEDTEAGEEQSWERTQRFAHGAVAARAQMSGP